MRTFESNLNAYHALNSLVELKSMEFSQRLSRATTIEGKEDILRESEQYFTKQGNLYKELGEEMVKIMKKHWWEFWE